MIDTHLHLSHARFSRDREAVLARTRAAGVIAAIEVGWDLASSQAAIALAARHRGVLFPAAGIHPHSAAAAPAGAIEALRALARSGAPLIAVGETGLDFFRNLSPREHQEDLFRAHIRLAQDLALPLIVHSRAATARVLAILTDEIDRAGGRSPGGVLHCFSGDRGEAEQAADLGFLIGVGGTLTYRDSGLEEVVRTAPASQLLLETDAPYLAPAPDRRVRNEPARLPAVRARVAALRGVSARHVDRMTTENAIRLFRLPIAAPEPTTTTAAGATAGQSDPR